MWSPAVRMSRKSPSVDARAQPAVRLSNDGSLGALATRAWDSNGPARATHATTTRMIISVASWLGSFSKLSHGARMMEPAADPHRNTGCRPIVAAEKLRLRHSTRNECLVQQGASMNHRVGFLLLAITALGCAEQTAPSAPHEILPGRLTLHGDRSFAA